MPTLDEVIDFVADVGAELASAQKDEIEILRPRHWLARRRMRLAKVLSSSQLRAQRYMGILKSFLRGEEDKDFAETAYKCLGKALGFVQEKK